MAAVRHPGDNWQDRSLITSGRYFGERPRQLSRVLDALLASPEWGGRIPVDRIGAVGHSAGGYSVLALAGAQAEPERAARHCRTVHDDPGFCALAKGPAERSLVAAGAGQRRHGPAGGTRLGAGPRVRAVVALAPMAVVFTPESLAAIRVPVLVRGGAGRSAEWCVPRSYVVAHLPGARATTAAGAGHFAFMAQSSVPLPSAAGDAAANPPGFDRMAFLSELEDQVAGVFAAQWR